MKVIKMSLNIKNAACSEIILLVSIAMEHCNEMNAEAEAGVSSYSLTSMQAFFH